MIRTRGINAPTLMECSRKKSKEEGIPTLPDELMCKIFNYCDRHSLRILHEVNKGMRHYSLQEITRKERRSAELRLVHTADRHSFILISEEESDASFLYTLDLRKVIVEDLLGPDRRFKFADHKAKIYGKLDKKYAHIVSTDPVRFEKNRTPFIPQFADRIRELRVRNSFRVLHCVNMLIDGTFARFAQAFHGVTDIEMKFESVTIADFDQEDYDRLCKWILSLKPTRVETKNCVGFCNNIINLNFLISLAELHESVNLDHKGYVVKTNKFIEFPSDELHYLCKFSELHLHCLRLKNKDFFELLNMKLNCDSSCHGHWSFILTTDIILNQVDADGKECEIVKDIKIYEKRHSIEHFIVESLVNAHYATFFTREPSVNIISVEINFFDH
ncbi:hypothetical protein PENTCL1PPCAC_28183 [Pristionchus entomophagus]|uniref:F-box domain-containing protein n=1 Tax=Pristionchus entomophagus TaxID=358040 RepID=A0AAV5UJA1_9BILA|nr:hypothetical protein PENTCL1PPCAC_28183 [Pristionchus entomophagus]